MSEVQQQAVAPATETPAPEAPQPQIQFTPIHMMTTNIWNATYFLGGKIDFASFAMIEQLMLEYESTIKNLIFLALAGNEQAYNNIKTQLQTHIRDRENLILTMSSNILKAQVEAREQAKKEQAPAPSDESAASAPSAPVALPEGEAKVA